MDPDGARAAAPSRGGRVRRCAARGRLRLRRRRTGNAPPRRRRVRPPGPVDARRRRLGGRAVAATPHSDSFLSGTPRGAVTPRLILFASVPGTARAPWQNTLPGDSASPSLACPWAPAPRPRSPTHTPSQFARKAGPHWGSAEGAARLSPAGCARSVVSDSHYPGAPAASLAATSASVDAADHAASAFMGGSSLGRASGTCQGEVLGAWSGRGFHEQNDHTTESKTCGGDCHGQERGPSREPAPEQRVLLHSSSGTYLTSGHDSGRLDS